MCVLCMSRKGKVDISAGHGNLSMCWCSSSSSSWCARGTRGSAAHCNRFLFHINCNTIVSNYNMFLTLPAFCWILLQQSLFSWLHHQHHLSTQQIRPFSDFLALVPRLYNYNSITQHKNTNPIQAMSHAISTYIGSTAAHRALASPLLVIRYLPNLVNTTVMMIMIHKIVIVVTSAKLWQVSVAWMAWVLLCRVLCSLLNGIFYLNIRYNFVLTIESSCLLHIYAQFYKVCFHWNLDSKYWNLVALFSQRT